MWRIEMSEPRKTPPVTTTSIVITTCYVSRVTIEPGGRIVELSPSQSRSPMFPCVNMTIDFAGEREGINCGDELEIVVRRK